MLVGCRFNVLTDHWALQHFLSQKKLLPCQAQWLEYLLDFDFMVKYIPRHTNVLADALSRLYAEDKPGVVHSPTEFLSVEMDNNVSIHSVDLNKIVTSPLDIVATYDD